MHSEYRRRRYYQNKETTSSHRFPIFILLIIIAGVYFYYDQTAFYQITQKFDSIFEPIKETAQEWIDQHFQNKSSLAGVQAQEEFYSSTCTQGNIAKILASTLLDTKQLSQESDLLWYSKYYRLLKTDDRFSFFKEENAMQPVSFKEVSDILQNILGKSFTIQLNTNEVSLDKYITLVQFLNIYEQALTKSKLGTLTYETLSIVATPANYESLKAWTMATDKGDYGFEGLILDSLRDYTVKAIVKDKEVLGIKEVISDTSEIATCYITEVREDSVVIKIADREFIYKNKVIPKSAEGKIVTLTVKNGDVLSYAIKEENNTDKVLRVTDTYIELEKEGRLLYHDTEVYDTRSNGKVSNIAQISSGTQVECSVKEGELKTLNIVDKPDAKKVRILISKDLMNNYLQDNVELISSEEYQVYYNNQKGLLKANTLWEADRFAWEKDCYKITFVPKQNSTMQIRSILRKEEMPYYPGSIEVYKEEDAYIVVNEATIEDYVAGVIGSEMPTQYGLEAAKVQAVAARSYVRANQNSSKFVKYGAQVDDTTASQVYNNVKVNDIAKEAAKKTKNEVMVYNGNIISGNFFSTSCGYTANYGEVWAVGDMYPANTPIYLVANKQYVGTREGEDLSDEENAKSFLKASADEIDAFDNHSPWFRWQLHLKADQLEQIINGNIHKLMTQYPYLVGVKNEKDEWESGQIESVGKIQDMKVAKRGQGGNIMELVIEGSEYTVKVSTEYIIRCLLAPVQKESGKQPITILRSDGTTVKDMSMLPSAFFTMDIDYDDNKKIKEMDIYGGGFGHGVGMSQEGVKGMIEKGYTYKKILNHFYPNVSVLELE